MHEPPLSVHLVLWKVTLKFSHLGLFFPLKTQAELVLVYYILHNYILNGGQDEVIPSEEDWILQ